MHVKATLTCIVGKILLNRDSLFYFFGGRGVGKISVQFHKYNILASSIKFQCIVVLINVTHTMFSFQIKTKLMQLFV
jgi:hypothetical protein